MRSYKQEKNQEGQPAAWRSSEGRMWEASPVPRKEGQDHLTGYQPSAAENKLRPREAGRLAGSYGDVAVGVSRKKELTMVISKRRNRKGPGATGEEKALKGESAPRMNLARGDFRVNSHDKKKSAVAYRESHKKPPQFLLERFKEMMAGRQQDILEEQTPFLNQKKEGEELGRLQSRAEELRAKEGGAAGSALRHIEARKQELRQRLTEKKTQERRLRLLLQKAQEESRRRAGETEPIYYRLPLDAGPVAEDTPPEEGSPNGTGESDESEGLAAARLLAAVLAGQEEKADEQKSTAEKPEKNDE